MVRDMAGRGSSASGNVHLAGNVAGGTCPDGSLSFGTGEP